MAVAEAFQAPPDVVIEPSEGLPDVRRAGDAVRLIFALAVLVPAVLLAALAHTGVRTTERGLLESIVTLPTSRKSRSSRSQFSLVESIDFFLD